MGSSPYKRGHQVTELFIRSPALVARTTPQESLCFLKFKESPEEVRMVKSQQQSSSVRKSCSGKVHKAEYNEMRQYLSKLKDLVPNMPKNRKVSKVEVIEHVIDYICQLQLTLENDPAAVLVSAMLENNNQIPANANRQPLGAIAANPNGLPTICSLEVSPCENSDCANRTVPC